MLGHRQRCEELRDLLPKVTDVPDVGQLPRPWNGVYLHKWVHEGYDHFFMVCQERHSRREVINRKAQNACPKMFRCTGSYIVHVSAMILPAFVRS